MSLDHIEYNERLYTVKYSTEGPPFYATICDGTCGHGQTKEDAYKNLQDHLDQNHGFRLGTPK